MSLRDITGATVGAELAGDGVVSAPVALVAVTTGAFVTPVGSASGLLLMVKFRGLGCGSATCGVCGPDGDCAYLLGNRDVDGDAR